jgi:hypothetical protein
VELSVELEDTLALLVLLAETDVELDADSELVEADTELAEVDEVEAVPVDDTSPV